MLKIIYPDLKSMFVVENSELGDESARSSNKFMVIKDPDGNISIIHAGGNSIGYYTCENCLSVKCKYIVGIDFPDFGLVLMTNTYQDTFYCSSYTFDDYFSNVYFAILKDKLLVSSHYCAGATIYYV